MFDDSDNDGEPDGAKRPILASKLLLNQHGALVEFGWTVTLKEMFNATRSEESSVFALLRNHEDTLIRKIYGYLSFSKFAKHVKLTVPAEKIGQGQSEYEMYDYDIDHRNSNRDKSVFHRQSLLRDLPEVSDGYHGGYVAYARLGYVTFPEPTGRNVNMMPFALGDVNSLPDDLKCYYPLIEQCPNVRRSGVAYLTVEESHVEVRNTQRRPGLHIEAPSILGAHETSCRPGRVTYWGMGYFVGVDQYRGGIYFASSVDSTCQVFDALVDKAVPGIADRHGGCEYLRHMIGDGEVLGANELVWMTDQTPHEALPQKESGYRQFFRLVMPEISHWFARHSTPNPKVPIPDGIIVVEDSKFETRPVEAI
jgi:hypothetical protein